MVRRRALLAVVTVVVMLFSVLSYYLVRSFNDFAKTARHDLLEELSKEIGSHFNERSNLANAQAQLIANIPWVQEAFKKKDRNTLQTELVPLFKELQKNLGAAQAQFHLPPAISFLRLHKPEKFDDDLSDFRKTVVLTNAKKQYQSGLEIGRAGVGVRGVVPVFLNSEHLGSFEFGFNIEPIIENFKSTSNADVVVFLKSDKFKIKNIANTQQAKNRRDLYEYHTVNYTNWEIFSKKKEILEKGLSNLSDGTQYYESSQFGLCVSPLRSFNNDIIGAVFIAKDFTDLEHKKNTDLILLITLLVVVLILIVGLIVVVFEGMLLRPLKDLTAQIQQMGSGEKIEYLDERLYYGELAYLAKQINTMRDENLGRAFKEIHFDKN